MKFVKMQLIKISTPSKIINYKIGLVIFHFTFGQLVYWSEQAKEANLKKSDRDNHMVSIQSPYGYLFHKLYFTICK